MYIYTAVSGYQRHSFYSTLSLSIIS